MAEDVTEHLDPKSLRHHLQSQVSLWISPATLRREATSDKIISHHQNEVRTSFPSLMGGGGTWEGAFAVPSQSEIWKWLMEGKRG